MDKKLKEEYDQFLILLQDAFKVKDQIEFEELIRYGKTIDITSANTSIIMDILTTKNVLKWKTFRVGGKIIYSYTLNLKM